MAARHYSLKKSAEAALASLLTGPGTSRAAHSKKVKPRRWAGVSSNLVAGAGFCAYRQIPQK